MRLKDGVDLVGLRREMREAFGAIDRTHQALADREATITSTTEGRHSVKRSAHYRGDAVDVRTWHVDGEKFKSALVDALGPDYVVILESDHMHVHWGPVFDGEPA